MTENRIVRKIARKRRDAVLKDLKESHGQKKLETNDIALGLKGLFKNFKIIFLHV